MEMPPRLNNIPYILVALASFALPFQGGSCLAQDNKPMLATPQPSPGELEKIDGLVRAASELREKLQNDVQRPTYHFMAPWGWMNDPNGAIFWKGKYHLFYQYCRNAAYPMNWQMSWGHASSKDLVHWTHHPIAIQPTPNGPDRNCCASGGAIINHGVPTLVYHGMPGGTCIATSQDDDLIHWTKHPKNPVIVVPKPDQNVEYGIYDPCAWRSGDSWYALTGWGRNFARPNAPEGDVAFLFKSPDLIHWQYLQPFYRSDRRWTDADEDCATPDFFPLGRKHMLLFMSHKRGCQYYIGTYKDDRFYPEQHGRMNWTGGQVIAPVSLQDDRGRRIMFAWFNEARTEPRHRAAGWAGMTTLPRELTLGDDNILRIEPVPELQSLRLHPRQRGERVLQAGSEWNLGDIRGDCLELQIEIQPSEAKQVGLLVRCSPDGAEQTSILYDTATKTLAIDGARSSLFAEEPPYVPILPPDERRVRKQAAPLALNAGEPLKLRVFLDHSAIEVFANGRQAIAQRIYPTRPDSLDVRVFSRGGKAKITKIEAWDMAAAGW